MKKLLSIITLAIVASTIAHGDTSIKFVNNSKDMLWIRSGKTWHIPPKKTTVVKGISTGSTVALCKKNGPRIAWVKVSEWNGKTYVVGGNRSSSSSSSSSRRSSSSSSRRSSSRSSRSKSEKQKALIRSAVNMDTEGIEKNWK